MEYRRSCLKNTFPLCMKFTFSNIALLALASLTLLVSGCLVAPVSQSGGLGSVTVTNSNPDAIIAAAQSVFPNYGYTLHGSHDLSSVSFDKDSNRFARVVWGSYGDPQTIRVKVSILPIPSSNSYRLALKVYTVSDAGVAGFESKRPLVGLWNSEFAPLLGQVAVQASGAGPL